MNSPQFTKQNSEASDLFLQNSCWCNAMRIYEVLQHLRASPSPVKLDFRHATQRLERWESQLGLSPTQLQKAWQFELKASAEEILKVLSVSEEFWQAAPPPVPTWVNIFSEICTLYDSDRFVPNRDFPAETPGLCRVAWPWIRWAKQRLGDLLANRWMRSQPETFDLGIAPDIFVSQLLAKLYLLLERTLVLEINVARIHEQLVGDNEDVRFDNFCNDMTTLKGSQRLWTEYPVLARILTEESCRWIDAVSECLVRLENDREQLSQNFCQGMHLGRLTSAEFPGDPHCAGRTVSILHFESGIQIVYKPRSMKADACFSKVLQYLNDKGLLCVLRVPRMLDCDTHGWSEFISARPCTSREERERFFFRQGELLAVCYFMQVTDILSENLIAASEEPVPVDVECILTPIHPDDRNPYTMAYGASLLSIGILPTRVSGGAHHVDLSAMGGRGTADMAPFLVPTAVNMGRESVRIESAYPAMPSSQNRPVPSGEFLDLKTYTEDVTNGFSAAFRLLCAKASHICTSPAVSDALESHTRVIARGTVVYGKLLRASTHPNLLRDALDRDAVFTKLWREGEWRSALVRHERHDLWNGDIPIFWTKPNSSDLIASTGAVLPGVMKQPASEQWKEHLQHTSGSSLQRHLWTIRSSLGGTAPKNEIGKSYLQYIQNQPDCPIQERCLVLSQMIARWIRTLTIQEGDMISWLDVRLMAQTGYQNAPTGESEVVPLGGSLYEGLAGMLMLFQYLGMATGESEFLDTAQSVARSLVTAAGRSPGTTRSIGAFTGVGSSLYALTHYQQHSPNADFRQVFTKLLNVLSQSLSLDQNLDLVHGTAGAICVLLGYARATKDESALELAGHCGEYLLERAIKTVKGIGWNVGNSVPLTGLAHGASGFAYALAELAQALGDQRYLAFAMDAVQFENHHFEIDNRNWEDLRDWIRETGSDKWANFGWCCGAPGIGLARLGMLGSHPTDSTLKKDIEVAIQTTVASGIGGNDCICHGTFGNLEFLWMAAQYLNRPALTQKVEMLLSLALDRVARDGFRFDSGSETIGLMPGLAGCAYALLRFARPDLVPCLLLLQGPLEIQSAARVNEFETL